MLYRDVRERFVTPATVLVSFFPPKSDLFVREFLSEEIRERVLGLLSLIFSLARKRRTRPRCAIRDLVIAYTLEVKLSSTRGQLRDLDPIANGQTRMRIASVLGLRIRDKRDRLIVTPFVRREAGVPLDHHSRGGERDHPSTCKIRAPFASRFGSEILEIDHAFSTPRLISTGTRKPLPKCS